MGKKATELHVRLERAEEERSRAVRVARAAAIFIRSILTSLNDEDRQRAVEVIERIKNRELEGWRLK